MRNRMRDTVTILGEVLLGKEESHAVRKRIVEGLAGLVGLRILFGVFSFGLSIFLARALGKDGFGTYSYAFAWIVVLGVPAILGTDQLLIREIAAYEVKKEWGLMRGLLRTANRAVLLVSLGIVGVAAAVSWAMRSHWSGQRVTAFWVGLLLLPLITLTRVRQAALQGLHRAVLGATPERLIQPALLIGLLVAAASLRREPLTAPFAMGLNVLTTAAAFVVGAWWLHRALPESAKEAEPVYRGRAWAQSALPMVFLAGMGILFGQAGTLILGALKGASAVGIYSVADKGAELLAFVLVAQNAAFSSTAASLYAAGDLERLQRLATRIARLTLLASLPPAIVFIGFGHWFLALGQLVNVGMGLNSVLLMMTGHERDSARAVAVSAGAAVLLNLVLIPRWGMVGAAISTAIAVVLLNVLATLALYRKTGIHSTVVGRMRLG
jgi:O-antigen/teichoic acid export membrane protein